MAKISTDLQQSKMLAEILPIESADMYYDLWDENDINVMDEHFNPRLDCRAWSLTALLGVLPNYQLQTQDDGIGILCSYNGNFIIITANNPVDACVEAVLKLHEQNLI